MLGGARRLGAHRGRRGAGAYRGGRPLTACCYYCVLALVLFPAVFVTSLVPERTVLPQFAVSPADQPNDHKRTSGQSREQRGLGRLKLAQRYPTSHVTRTPLSRSKGQRSKCQRSTCRGRGHIVEPPAQLVKISIILTYKYNNIYLK